MRSRDELHAYQVEAVNEMLSRDEAMVWASFGAGKTAISLTVIADLGEPALVVGTKHIVERTWPKEIAEWEHLQHLTYAAATGAKRSREKAIETDPDILGVNYENLIWLYANGFDADRPILILDEVSKLKAHNTKRFRAHLRHMSGFNRRFGLTATPASQSYIGLYGQTRSTIAEDYPLGRTITEFRSRYTREDFKGNYTEYAVTEVHKRNIRSRLRPYVITVESPKREEPTFIDRIVPWRTTGSRERYQTMEQDLVAALRATSILAASKGVAYNKCRQLASGFIYDSDKVAHTIDEDKMLDVVEAYEEMGDDPVLLFYQFQWERDYLLEAIDGSEPLSTAALEKWDKGELPAMIVHPASAGHGLNLQGPCRHIFWVSLPWSLEQYLQSNGRIDRQGQSGQVVITRFMRENSIEQDVLDNLQGLWTDQEELIERIQERL